ncbi:MAG: FAD binding domain-containing protein [Pseudomonadota bacterium]
MIPAAFDYHRPASLAEAVSLLETHGDEARVLAGGHSLIPMMKVRMADLSHLVDMADIAELKGIEVGADTLRIGAMTTQNALIESEALAAVCPLIREAAFQIADPQVRYMGTIGGNIAGGDPANDMPGLMQCLDARFELSGPSGTRLVPARGFYESAYVTARAEDEILVRVHIPVPAKGHGYAYEKQKRKIGDYATAAAAVLIAPGSASIAMTNLADTPIHVPEAGAALAAGDTAGAIEAALAAIDPVEDIRGPRAFKLHLARQMLARAIARAEARAETVPA